LLCEQQGSWSGRAHVQSLLVKQPTQACVDESQMFFAPLVQFASPRQATHFCDFMSQ
jgi:hypothetical protein